jgi:hypothetical protein
MEAWNFGFTNAMEAHTQVALNCGGFFDERRIVVFPNCFEKERCFRWRERR